MIHPELGRLAGKLHTLPKLRRLLTQLRAEWRTHDGRYDGSGRRIVELEDRINSEVEDVLYGDLRAAQMPVVRVDRITGRATCEDEPNA